MLVLLAIPRKDLLQEVDGFVLLVLLLRFHPGLISHVLDSECLVQQLIAQAFRVPSYGTIPRPFPQRRFSFFFAFFRWASCNSVPATRPSEGE